MANCAAGVAGVSEMGELSLCGGEIAALVGRNAGAKVGSRCRCESNQRYNQGA